MRLLNQSLTEYVFIMIDLNEDFNFMLTKESVNTCKVSKLEVLHQG